MSFAKHSKKFNNYFMSKRFVLHASKEEIKNYFSVDADVEFNIKPNYNISAGAIQPIVVGEEEQRKIKKAKWGLIPPDSDNERAGKDHCVVQVEESREEDWIEESFEERRALIPATGFYKWKDTENKSTPFYVRLLSGNIMALGGVYRRWKSESGREVYSFAVLATEANALVEPVDDRMPVIVRPDDFEQWLDKKTNPEEILKQIEDYSAMLTEMIVNRVSEDVNDINNNSAGLIQPIPK